MPLKKLSEPKVRAIRYLYWVKRINQTCLARMYGVSTGAVHDAVHYITWDRVPDNFTHDQVQRGGYFQ